MKTILTGILSLFIFFGAVPSANAQAPMCAETCEMACADEVKKKKKKKKKKAGKGKKKKKGFFSKAFGSK
jgi:hypothetical protein